MTFDSFIAQLLTTPSSHTTITVKGNPKRILGMSRYASKNMPKGEYLKIVFVDHSLMVILLADQEIYYADQPIGELETINDEQIGVLSSIKYLNQEFELINKHDYQYVIHKYVGGLEDIEGECSFSDYAPKDGTKSMLSLGIISQTGKRADVYCEQIDLVDMNL